MVEDPRKARIRALFAEYGEILTTEDVAKVLGYTNQTITTYIAEGTIRAFRLGGRQWRIVREDLIEDLTAAYNVDHATSPRHAGTED